MSVESEPQLYKPGNRTTAFRRAAPLETPLSDGGLTEPRRDEHHRPAAPMPAPKAAASTSRRERRVLS